MKSVTGDDAGGGDGEALGGCSAGIPRAVLTQNRPASSMPGHHQPQSAAQRRVRVVVRRRGGRGRTSRSAAPQTANPDPGARRPRASGVCLLRGVGGGGAAVVAATATE